MGLLQVSESRGECCVARTWLCMLTAGSNLACSQTISDWHLTPLRPCRLLLLQVAAINTAMSALVKTLNVFPKERSIVSRERTRKAYNVLPYLSGAWPLRCAAQHTRCALEHGLAPAK